MMYVICVVVLAGIGAWYAYGAGEQRHGAAAAAEEEIKEGAARGKESGRRAAGQASQPPAGLSLAQQRDALLDEIDKQTILHEKYLIDVQFFNEQINLQQEYQDFLSQVLNGNNDVNFINQKALNAFNLMTVYLDKTKKTYDQYQQLIQKISRSKVLDEEKKRTQKIKFAQEGVVQEKRQVASYSPPSSWWDKFLVALSLRYNPADIRKEVDSLSKKLSRVNQDYEASKKTALERKEETVTRSIDIKNTLMALADSNIELSKEEISTIAKMHTWLEVSLEEVEKIHQLALKIYNLNLALNRLPTTY